MDKTKTIVLAALLVLLIIVISIVIVILSTSSSILFGQQNNVISQPSKEELRNYALQLINEDRAKHGIPSVKLSNNQASQIQAEDMLKSETLSHYMTNGEKPYMVYNRYGGLGDLAQNIAWKGYADVEKCINGFYSCDVLNIKNEINSSEYTMMYNDSDHNWGHRDNILDTHHTDVSIGIAFDKYSFYLVQNFENNYINYTVPISEKNGTVNFSGNLKSGLLSRIMIYYDPLPTSSLYEQHKGDGFYTMGDLVAGVLPPAPSGQYYPPSNSTNEVANVWIQQGNHVRIAFDISPFVTRPGVYTIISFLNTTNDEYPVTSYSITKTAAMFPEGFKSSNVQYACSSFQLDEYNQLLKQYYTLRGQLDPLQKQYDIQLTQFNSRPQIATTNQEYQEDLQMYNQLSSLRDKINGLISETNYFLKQLDNFRC